VFQYIFDGLVGKNSLPDQAIAFKNTCPTVIFTHPRPAIRQVGLSSPGLPAIKMNTYLLTQETATSTFVTDPMLTVRWTAEKHGCWNFI